MPFDPKPRIRKDAWRSLRYSAYLDAEDALDHEGPLPMFPDERELAPRAVHALREVAHPLVAQAEQLQRLRVALLHARVERGGVVRERGDVVVRVRREAVQLHERGVGERDLRADGVVEGQVRGVDVVRPPAERHGVHGHDERAVPGPLGAVQEGQRDVRNERPVRSFVVVWGSASLGSAADARTLGEA